MKAIAHDSYGTADGLELREVGRPAIGDDEVLVSVRAAGVDRGVWHVMTGLPYPIRLAEVDAGEVVTFVVQNKGKAEHEFVLGDADYQEQHEGRHARRPRDVPRQECCHGWPWGDGRTHVALRRVRRPPFRLSRARPL